MNAPLIREGLRLTYITFVDPVRDQITGILDIITVFGSAVLGRDPRQVLLQRYKGR